MTLQRFSRSTLTATPWKNGGGTTREIVCWPPGTGLDAFDWRASIATIAAPGPFSVFAGVRRTIMLLDGDGVRLRSAGFDHRLDVPHEPFAFDGDAAVDCDPLGATSTDFNVMARRGRGTAEVRIIDTALDLAPSAHGLLMGLDGRWHVNDDVLAPGEGLWWTDRTTTWRLRPEGHGARLLAVQWRPGSEKTDGHGDHGNHGGALR
jgi:environmental stress-induced protein Ves